MTITCPPVGLDVAQTCPSGYRVAVWWHSARRSRWWNPNSASPPGPHSWATPPPHHRRKYCPKTQSQNRSLWNQLWRVWLERWVLRLCKASRVFGPEVIMRNAAQKSVSPLIFTFLIHLLKEIAFLTCLKSLVTAGRHMQSVTRSLQIDTIDRNPFVNPLCLVNSCFTTLLCLALKIKLETLLKKSCTVTK